MIEFFEYHDAKALADELAAFVAADLAAALREKGRATFAAPGGKTPRAFLAALAEHPLDWARVKVIPGDERWVSPGDERSNERMIRDAMAEAAPGVFSFWREGEEPEEATPHLAAALGPLLPLDAVVIGMGEDMHCASLFPGAEALQKALWPEAPAVMAIRAPGAQEPRLTLTVPALAGAGRLRLLIRGEAKREAYERAMAEPDPLKAPVGAVLRAARDAEVHWAP